MIQGADTKEGAAIYPAIFWISITIFRFVFAVVNLKVTQKLKLLILIQIGVFVTTILFAYLGYDLLAIYWSSILSGLAYSSMYALIYTTSL